MRCKLATALVIVGLVGYAGWRYWDWAVKNFDPQSTA